MIQRPRNMAARRRPPTARTGAAKPRRTEGMFPEFEAPELEEFFQLRRMLSRRLLAASVPNKKR